MNELQQTKFIMVTPPGAKLDDASATTAEIDTAPLGLKYDFLRYIVILGDTDIAMAALAATQSDTTGANHTNITGAVFGTSLNTAGSTSALPSADDDNKIFVIELDLKGKKRFIDLTATAGNGSTGTYITIIAELSRGSQPPLTATARGISQILRA